MNKWFLVLLALLLTATVAVPQRYGRPYSLAESPTLLLEVRVQNKSHYFRVADLQKMQRTTVIQTDPASKAKHVYEGVALEQLIPGTNLASPEERIEIEFASHQIATISATDLDLQVKPTIADKVDGNLLSGHAPYCLVLKSRGKAVETIAEVQRIVVRSGK